MRDDRREGADALLPLLLGLAALVHHLDAWIEADPVANAMDDRDLPLDLLLGAVSLRHALLAALVEAAATPLGAEPGTAS